MRIIIALAFTLYSAIIVSQNKPLKLIKMEVAVWDTYVQKKDGTIMHFDIVAPTSVKDANSIHAYGKQFLKEKRQEGQPLSAKECRFCHIEKATEEMENAINKKGYFIIEMQGCN